MNLKKNENSDWQEGYINNVWCKFKTFLSSSGDLFVIAKQDSKIKVFKLSKKTVEENKDKDLNEVMEEAEEVDEIPDFIPKKWFEK